MAGCAPRCAAPGPRACCSRWAPAPRATARRRIGRLLLLTFRRGGSAGVEAQRIADAIGGEIGPEAVEETSRFLGLDDEAQERQEQRGGRWSLRTILTLPLLPFALLN